MIFIFSGPSGVGKSTIINALRQKRDFQFSVSYTSRNIREGEYNGEDYNFVSETEFLKLIDEDSSKFQNNYDFVINDDYKLTTISNKNNFSDIFFKITEMSPHKSFFYYF